MFIKILKVISWLSTWHKSPGEVLQPEGEKSAPRKPTERHELASVIASYPRMFEDILWRPRKVYPTQRSLNMEMSTKCIVSIYGGIRETLLLLLCVTNICKSFFVTRNHRRSRARAETKWMPSLPPWSQFPGNSDATSLVGHSVLGAMESLGV